MSECAANVVSKKERVVCNSLTKAKILVITKKQKETFNKKFNNK